MLPLLAANAGLLALHDLARHLESTLLLLGVAFVSLAVAVRHLERLARPVGGIILLVAALLRGLMLPLPPVLSDDLLRYVWDGRVAAAGYNPYRLAPEAEELAPLRDELWRRMPHREVPTVYPPLALGLFTLAARLPFPLAVVKLLLTAADLGTCGVLLAIARRRGIAQARVAWYAWNPLAALEVAGMGHVDALGVAAVAVGVLYLVVRPPRALSSAVALAGGVLAKLVPAAALPMWSRQSGRPLAFLGVACGLVALSLLPVATATGGVPPGLLTYGVSWEFDGPVFEPLWRLLDRAGTAPAIARRLDDLKRAHGHDEALNRLYPFVYPQLLAKLMLGAAMLVLIALAVRWPEPVAGTGALFGGLLLLSATVYPWYLLWVLPWAALCRQRAWLALSGLILLSYLTQRGGMPLLPWVFAAIWLPFLALHLVFRRWSTA